MSKTTAQLEAITRRLADSLGIVYESVPHQLQGKTTADALRALDETPDHLLKSLVLVDAETQHTVGVLIRGDKKINIDALREVTGLQQLSLASLKEVKKITGFDPGSVPPFSIIHCGIRVASPELFASDYLIGAGGHPNCGIKIKPVALKNIPELLVEDVSK